MTSRQQWPFVRKLPKSWQIWGMACLSGIPLLFSSGCGGGGVLGAYAKGQGYLRVRSDTRCPPLQILYQTQNFGALPPEGTLDLGKVYSSGVLNACETTKTAPSVNNCIGFTVTLNVGSTTEASLTCISADPLDIRMTLK